jgi:uncharacterized DUF497 family protein
LRGMESRSRMLSGSSRVPTLEKVDDRFDYGEIRVYAIGIVNDLEITVIYTDVSETERRIISAWRAEQHEREAYWRNIV